MKAALVTTEFRGVFLGYIKDDSKLPAEITLTKARNVIYWDAKCKGVFGLASGGPKGDTRLGLEVPEITLYKITSVTPAAEKFSDWEG